jgi:hypothetical protein
MPAHSGVGGGQFASPNGALGFPGSPTCALLLRSAKMQNNVGRLPARPAQTEHRVSARKVCGLRADRQPQEGDARCHVQELDAWQVRRSW